MEGPARGPFLLQEGGTQAPSCVVSSGPLPLWLLLQEAAAWAAACVLGGGRVVAGRGLDQECVSRNVAALPAECGVGDRAGGLGWGVPERLQVTHGGFCLCLEWDGGVLPESLPVATHFCLRPPPGEGAHGR